MKEITFIAELGNIDAQGDKINIDGIRWKENSVKVIRDFNPLNVIGSVNSIDTSQGTVKISASIKEDEYISCLDAYPAVCFRSMESEQNEHGGYTFKEIRLYGVSLSSSPNSDPSIRKLSDQIDS